MPQVIVSTTTTLDGYLDDNTANRLILSSEEDMYDMHRLRARVDAIVIGAETLRKDNPRLDTRYAERQPEPPPVKVVITRSGAIPPAARFFSEGPGKKIVLCLPDTPLQNLDLLSSVATVVPCRPEITAKTIIDYLTSIGLTKIMVEGGAATQEMFFAEACVDILRLGHAPLLLGSSGGARFLSSANFTPATLTTLSVEKLGDTTVSWYQVKSNAHLLRRAANLISQPPPERALRSPGGTIILNKHGIEITGTYGELLSVEDATETALIKAQNLNIDIEGASVFASGELNLLSHAIAESFCSLLLKSRIKRLVMPTRQNVETEAIEERLTCLKSAGIAVEWYDIS